MSSPVEVRPRVKRFGLVGNPLAHSLSPLIHERIMEAVGLKGSYELFDLAPNELPRELPRLLASLDGFNCTIPHKQAVIPYLNDLVPSAKLYGAVNTVCQGWGYNTDGVGFASCGVPLQGQRVCVFGAGGVARVLAMEAARAGATSIAVQARNAEQATGLVDAVRKQGYGQIHALAEGADSTCDVILNGTPVGMWPNLAGTPVSNRQIEGAKAVFDTIYNPSATGLVLRAKSRGLWAMGGLQMLFEQALAAQRIWNPEVDWENFTDGLRGAGRGLALEVLRRSPFKLVLTGFMGSGKTQVGQALAQRLGSALNKSAPSFVDLDHRVVIRAGQSIPEIFRSQGEAAFRSLERDLFAEELQRPGAAIVATGGGTLIQEGLAEMVRRSGGFIVYLDVSLEEALRRIGRDDQRPLLQRGPEEIRVLYDLRKPLYEEAADLRVVADGKVSDIVEMIMTAFRWNG